MWQGPTSGLKLKSIAAGQWQIVCLLIAVLVPAIGRAEESTRTTVMRSGLHSFFNGHSALLTVSEIGTGKSSSFLTTAGPLPLVTIEFRDDTDRQVGVFTGWLAHGKPVRLEMPIQAAVGLAQVRATVTIVGPANGSSVPMAVWEDLDLASRTIGRIIGGSPQSSGPFDPKPFSYDCPPPGWTVTIINPAGG